MPIVTVSDKGQVVIPAEIRRHLGITAGSRLDFSLEGETIRIELVRRVPPSRPEDGFGMLRCTRPGERRLANFDVADALRQAADDRA
jgi:antitoxin PrlF